MKLSNFAIKLDPDMRIGGSTLRGVGIAFTNLGLATLYLLFAIANARSFIENPRLSVFLIVVTETIVAIFLLMRRDPDETRHSWQTWITTTGGTIAPFFLRPIDASADVLAGEILQILGFCLQIAAVFALNRSFGLLPAHRSVKSSGAYRLVRHPLYTAYVVTFLGYWISNQSFANGLVALLGTAFLVMRIHHEEALLTGYTAYQQYADRTRWRLIPAVW
ncbi:MAG: isoprenylcysteine carboxyl methyltransferase [Gammaproteobacteria bacterium]|nr:isoprenylcysteine carboxyl methyltransferase [Gammaproteobacteria bacterium]